MVESVFKTPLYAAFFCAVILAACTSDPSDPPTTSTPCPGGNTPIASVQGSTPKSPIAGQQVSVHGIVTLLQADGFYMEEPGSDAIERTSNAVFIQTARLPGSLAYGSVVSVSGVVSEIDKGRHSLTAITDVTELIQCSSGLDLPLTDVSLPLNGLQREALEGMRIQINDPLMVTDVYRFGRGNFTLSGNGLQFVPTEIRKPGAESATLLEQNRAFALPAMLPDSMDQPELLVSGSQVDYISGILAHDERGLRISLESITSNPHTGFTAPDTASPGTLRVVGMNLHNYFNGEGKALSFPGSRGAKTAAEFKQQRDRIGAAIGVLDPQLIAVMELENDGFDDDSAAVDFIQLATSVSGKSWAVTRPAGDDTGTDEIAVGLFYRSDRLKPIGPAQTLGGEEFTFSRQPQAQVFQPLPDGEKILVVINHLKSKGSCPDEGENTDQKDGQGCWNPMRLAAAKRMSAWAKNVALSTGTENILILGDMNAYRNEDPINAIRQAGFKELMDEKQGKTYSFVFFGQHGTLDYAFSSESLLDNIDNAFIWNVNAAVPVNMELPQPWLGFSDHDPVVVDIKIN